MHDSMFFTLPFFVARVLVVKLFGKRFLVCAQSVGPINTSLGRILLRIGASLADVITVRDPLSAGCLSEVGIPTVLAPDAAFAIDIVEPKVSNDEFPEMAVAKRKNPIVGIALRSPVYFKSAKPENFEHVIADGADYLIERLEAKVVFIPLVKASSTSAFSPRVIDDLLVIQSVLSKMRNPKSARILKRSSSLSEMLTAFAKLDLLIGVPLHSLIFSTIVGTPFIAIDYHPKVRGYLRMIEYDKAYQANAGKLNSETLVEKIEQIWAHRRAVKKKLLSVATVCRMQSYLNIEWLPKLFEIQQS